MTESLLLPEVQNVLERLPVAVCVTAVAATLEKRPAKVSNLKGPLGDTPKHVTDA
jgi:hypothetical protein